jgi:CubicO group peptidase (beta-lactamase class C family)
MLTSMMVRPLAMGLLGIGLGACGVADPALERQASAEAAHETFPGAPAPAPTLGLDERLIESAMAEAAALPRLRTLLVARHGEILAERHFRGPGLDQPANVKSVSKSVLSAVVGIAIAEGSLAGVDQRIAPFFERHLRAGDDPRKQRITVGNLLSMQSGLQRTSGAFYVR